MLILSHRGQWTTPEERNSPEAFVRSFRNGFGIETDLRDAKGRIVISHDPPKGSPITLDELLEIYQAEGGGLPLALNIKADGLQALVGASLHMHRIENYYLFDMSVPDMPGYISEGLRVFTRQSDVEPEPAFYAEASGVWLDSLRTDWIESSHIRQIFQDGKLACLVSPELHGQPHLPLWNSIKSWHFDGEQHLMLCTDFPQEAKVFFEDV